MTSHAFTRRRRLLARLPMVAWLTLVWVLLWGTFDIGTFFFGLVVAVLVVNNNMSSSSSSSRRIIITDHDRHLSKAGRIPVCIGKKLRIKIPGGLPGSNMYDLEKKQGIQLVNSV